MLSAEDGLSKLFRCTTSSLQHKAHFIHPRAQVLCSRQQTAGFLMRDSVAYYFHELQQAVLRQVGLRMSLICFSQDSVMKR
jgi:hypothetical protein